MDPTYGHTLYNVWWGGRYGAVMIGPGRFFFHKAAKYGSGVRIIGSGKGATRIEFPDNLYPGLNDNTFDIFKSKSWDTGSLASSNFPTGEMYVMFKDLQIYGNFIKNQIPAVNTATCTGLGTAASPETAGTDSWGHGIAHYGGGLLLDNLIVHGCPGAGIIIQSAGAGQGGGYGYPINTFTNLGGSPPSSGGQQYDTPLNIFTNIVSYSNGRQGILARAGCTYINGYWSYWCGEAGLDFQQSDYFDGWGSLENAEIFENGYQHGAQAAPQNTAYDPLGFNVGIRSASSSWIDNCWIETSMGNADNLMIGSAIGAPTNPTGFQIKNVSRKSFMSNCFFDYPRSSAIYVGPNSSITIRSTTILAVPQPNSSYDANRPIPLMLLGSGDIELSYSQFNSSVFGHAVDGVVIGNQNPSIGVWGSRLRLYCGNNDYAINNQNTGNRGDIEVTFVDTTASTKYLLNPASVALDYANNPITVKQIGHWAGSAVGTRSNNGGAVTLTGNGTTTVFNITHLLFDIPRICNLRPKNAAAAALAVPYITADATNVTVTFASAPPAGSYDYWWDARVCA